MSFQAHREGLYRLVCLLIVGVAIVRIVSTYHVFNQTVDEPSNISCGMQLIQDRQYFMDVKHPPLTRVAGAIGLYLEGARLPDPGLSDNMFELGNEILATRDRYWHNLTLARLGLLPFFVLACFVVWSWSRHLFGKAAGLLALLLFSLLPPVLAHSGIVTNDMAAAATLAAALYCFTLWLESPTWRAAAWLGIAAGLAAASKFSTLVFLPACSVVVIVLALAVKQHSLRSLPFRKMGGQLLVSCLLAYFVLWAGYLFTVAPLQSTRPHAAVDRLLGRHPLLHDAAADILETPIPGGKVAAGLAGLSGQNRAGQVSFFLGEWRRTGWWFFFPFLLLVKTPLAFLLLFCIGAVFVARSFQRDHDWRPLVPLSSIGVVLGIAMLSTINIGLRHILPVYPLMSIVAGYAVTELWAMPRRPLLSRGVAVVAVVSVLAGSVLAHPDYLAYFNVLASERPERIEVDSDVDWGQDLARLSGWLRARGVQEVAVSYFGTMDLAQAGLPRYHELQPYQKVTGWVAISARNRAIPSPFVAKPLPGMATFYSVPGDFGTIKAGNGPFSWLQAYRPVARIGYSIFVYNIPSDR